MKAYTIPKIDIDTVFGKPLENIAQIIIYSDAVWITFQDNELKIIKLDDDGAIVVYDDETKKEEKQ